MWKPDRMPEILTISAMAIDTPDAAGAWPLDDISPLQQVCWRERASVESDEAWLQLIPYVLLQNQSGRLWCYRRSGGDERLADRRSCGLGGHVEREDQATEPLETLLYCARRELAEELSDPSPVAALTPLAWIYEGESAVGRVHIGVLCRGYWRHALPPRIADGELMQSLAFHAPQEIVGDERFELWSRLAAGWLHGESE